jgi:hypothetical protein
MILFNYKNIRKTTPMTTSTLKHKESLTLVAATFATVLLLTLSAMSIHVFISKVNDVKVVQKENVLGVSKQNNEKDFWMSFLADNPYYYPGWKRLNEISLETGDVKLLEQTKNELTKLKALED